MESLRANTLRLLRTATHTWVGAAIPRLDEALNRAELLAVGAGEQLLQPGEEHRCLYYIVQGAVRTESLVRSRLIVDGIRLEGEMVLDVPALGLPFMRRATQLDLYPGLNRIPGMREGVGRTLATTLEPTILLRFDLSGFASADVVPSEWPFVGYFLAHEMTARHEFAQFRVGTPIERYTAVRDERPDLVRRITQRELAGLLGVSEAGLSRVVTRVNAATPDPDGVAIADA